MAHKVITLNVRNRAGAIALATVALVLGGALLAFGLLLLAGLVGAGAVIGAGVMLYHKLTGRWPGRFATMGSSRATLDPAKEVFPQSRAERRLPGSETE